MYKQRITFTLSQDIVEFLDENKGRMSRSAYAENLLGGLLDLYSEGEINMESGLHGV